MLLYTRIYIIDTFKAIYLLQAFRRQLMFALMVKEHAEIILAKTIFNKCQIHLYKYLAELTTFPPTKC